MMFSSFNRAARFARLVTEKIGKIETDKEIEFQ